MIEIFDALNAAPFFTLALGAIVVSGLALYAVIIAMKIFIERGGRM